MPPHADLTYREVGATRDDALPPGYDHAHRDVPIGAGRGAFDAAVDGLFSWRMHRGAGLRIDDATPPADTGTEVLLRFGLGPIRLRVPCRVVYTVAEANRRGFAYGTLPGHPERGEELFLLELTDPGEVRCRIRAFSRPATLLARAGGPVSRLTQRYLTDRYIRALRSIAAGSPLG
ncbi:DUF1990 family protein [Actinoplanes sp. NPDC051859]|uniref:DUF1990 family protein n=1 Tax=Actinoplanes sp. NPDC051859 TaxID=3363909 RepID=UPI0037BB6B3D